MRIQGVFETCAASCHASKWYTTLACVLCVIDTDAEHSIDREDDANWPEPDRVGKQELEIVTEKEHISFVVCSMQHTHTHIRTYTLSLPFLLCIRSLALIMVHTITLHVYCVV
jgi:hypothetical protein